ncbi:MULTISPECIES: preprotein translocase subunit SecA [unclassified Siphonobacter]|uniref:preprotein translocase subunit SecA n=1 Tax=unclassified Siphonobacter TaxID=2635712 RepID=UPI00277F2654|nr:MULTISPECIES: preprotein translocase subunit SecA [unclassified Siphonobacter]MDQ1088696.1 preprotein translocase subunit SecA [Siphonobacter sp. SORGH_AS_1065]MDR6194840.1 preprotein translocase subunit SecA [Siphonobacter sp. SORGH_AS_0500]
MFKLITKIFGTKSDRDLKELYPYVGKINAEFAKLRELTDEQLRQETAALKSIIKQQLAPITDQVDSIRQRIESNPDLDVNEKDSLFKQIDALEVQSDQKLEEVLLEILPRAFAIVKETGRRYTENGELVVTATVHDRFVASRKSNVVIEGEKATWKNTWNVMGQPITWNMIHYDVQLIGGVVLHQGKIAEMATGEGKTLVSTLPSFLNALAGKGVHIVTVNDYLAKRDSEWNAPLFEFHGMTVDCIDRHEPNTHSRRNAYLADITYGTNNEFGFDYLRDNMARSPEELVQRKHHYAMVDEVDSVLIDDARTPLIISGPMVKDNDVQEFEVLNPRISRLVEEQQKLVQGFLTEARRLIAAGNTKEGGLALFRAHRGLPKYKPLIKYLSEQGNQAVMRATENEYLQEQGKRMPEADAPLYFVIEEKNNSVELTEKGIDVMTANNEDPNFFILPDLSVALNKIEKSDLSEVEKIHKKDEIIRDYSIKTQRIHTVNQLLKAHTLFELDVEYVIMDGKIKIVDEQTGRIMEGRRYSDGLHQAIEAKERVKVEDATQTYATVTLQNYFRMYHKLSGMTGTAETEAGEFWQIYKLDVVSIPTNLKISRKDQEDKVYKTVREKYNAVVQEIDELVKAGRPVLVGTTSVENSEILSRLLRMRGIKHQVLNAKQHQREAEIVATAGHSQNVTIATNMAGRGTDIKLTPESKAAGGLAIIGTERHESRRVDRQLRGRAGRQGDPGSSQFFVSLEDNLMRLFGSERIAKVMDRMGMEEGEVIQHSMITSSIERAQKKVEENNFGIRKRLLEYDDVMNYQREAIYKRRKNALFGDRLALDIANITYDVCEELVSNNPSFEEFELRVIETLAIQVPFTKDEFVRLKPEQRTQQLYAAAEGHYQSKGADIARRMQPFFQDLFEANQGNVNENSVIGLPYTDGEHVMGFQVNFLKALNSEGREVTREIEKNIALTVIDQEWKEHLRDMDDLKQSVQNAVFEQKDPLLIYKFESIDLFKQFINKVNFDIVQMLMRYDVPELHVEQPQVPQPPRRPEPQPQLQLSKDDVSGLTGGDGPSVEELEEIEVVERPRQQPIRVNKIEPNQRVSVQYSDGRIERDVKYKKVEEDVKRGICVVID